MNTIIRWIIRIVIVLALAYGAYLFLTETETGQALSEKLPLVAANEGTTVATAGTLPAGSAQLSAEQLTNMTVAVQPAATVFGNVSASGNIELSSEQSVVAEVSSTVTEILVDTGDSVRQGDVLIRLDTVDLERAVQVAELDVRASQNTLAQLMEETDAADIAVAEAKLAEAQENLADVQAGPSNEEVAAARATVTSAWAKYNELLAGASDAQLTQLSADMRKKEITLAEAQRAYNEIAWKNDSAATSQAAALEQATIDYESAVASYQEATAPAETSEIQSAYSSAQDAESQLDALLNSPTAAEVATAQSAVVDAQATLDDLHAGPTATDLEEVRISLEKALIELEEAHSDLAKAVIRAPIDGAVVAVEAEVGKRVEEGGYLLYLTDPTALELTIEVAEVDMPSVEVGQPAAVTIDAFPGATFAGTVENVSFTSDSTSGIVTYPITIQLTDAAAGGTSLEKVLPGMTAVATLSSMDAADADGWLVPNNAVRTQGENTVVMAVFEGQPSPISVTTGGLQGEWTVVYSDELAEGDMVVGSVTSFISDEEQQQFGPPGGGLGGNLGGGTRPPGTGGGQR